MLYIIGGARGHVKYALHRSLPAVEPAVGYGKPMSFVAAPPPRSEDRPPTSVAAPKTASTQHFAAAVASPAAGEVAFTTAPDCCSETFVPAGQPAARTPLTPETKRGITRTTGFRL